MCVCVFIEERKWQKRLQKKRERLSGKEGAEKRNGYNSENYNRKENEKI